MFMNVVQYQHLNSQQKIPAGFFLKIQVHLDQESVETFKYTQKKNYWNQWINWL